MNKLRSIIAANRNFLLCYGFFFLVGLIILLAKGKTASFMMLNPFHQTLLDYFFIGFTYLGDGIFTVAIIILLMALRRWNQAWQLLTAFLLSALLAQVFKELFHMPRPLEVFNHGEYGYFIEGITNHGHASFPSGHSTSVFTLATMLAIFETNKKMNIFYLLTAVAVGYSRIYLGQHFLTDVLMGSCLGVLSSLLVHWVFPRRKAQIST